MALTSDTFAASQPCAQRSRTAVRITVSNDWFHSTGTDDLFKRPARYQLEKREDLYLFVQNIPYMYIYIHLTYIEIYANIYVYIYIFFPHTGVALGILEMLLED